MPTTPAQFHDRLDEIRARLVEQGHTVEHMAERAFETFYSRDAQGAREMMGLDDKVDEADLEIERAAVALLSDATRDGCSLDDAQLRGVLTAVKVNNELERIADAATAIAERVVNLNDRETRFPKTTMVMTNSVIGIIHETIKAYGTTDPTASKAVLASEDAVLNFNSLILRDAEERVADGRMTVDLAFDLHAIVSQAVLMADHCTNIAEQVIYAATGAVVRHREGAWKEIEVRSAGND
ncbi:MAG: phosphate transport system protein [Phycisphaerales bacterium]|jgi:phosphate transport system protein